MSDPVIDEFKATLAACKTIPKVDLATDEAWAHFQPSDAVNNTLVLNLAEARKTEIRAAKQDKAEIPAQQIKATIAEVRG